MTALLIANGKVNLTFLEAVSKGILCNILVCLAVYLCFSGRSVTDKILAILFPITAFIALGFEHSIANMYFIPAGLLIKNNTQVLAAAQGMIGEIPDLSNLTISGFILDNLLGVTIGNIIMTSPLISVDIATPVYNIYRTMAEHHIRQLLITEDGKQVGFVSVKDLIAKPMF